MGLDFDSGFATSGFVIFEGERGKLGLMIPFPWLATLPYLGGDAVRF